MRKIMLTLKFYKISEKMPEPDEEVIWLSKVNSFGFTGFNPRQVTADYYWDDDNGTRIGFDENDPEPPESEDGEVWCKCLSFDGIPVDEDDYWIPVEEYWSFFDTDEE